jgi:hypothetical protein
MFFIGKNQNISYRGNSNLYENDWGETYFIFSVEWMNIPYIGLEADGKLKPQPVK